MNSTWSKVSTSIHKIDWHPCPLLGQLALVTTVSADGIPNVAPKNWLSIVVGDPPIIALGCNLGHHTAQNILDTGEFVLNFPGDDLAATVWRSGLKGDHERDPRDIVGLGLTSIPSLAVRSPRIAECRAHLECRLESTKEYGQEIVLFGQIVAASIDEAALKGDPAERYAYLRPIVYLEGSMYGVVERGHEVRLEE